MAPLTMVLAQQQCHLTGLHGSVDADGCRRIAFPITVLAHNQPSAISPLHDLGTVDLSHRYVSLFPMRSEGSTLGMAGVGCPLSPEIQFVRDEPVNS